MEKLEKFQVLVSCLIITFGILIATVIFASKISKIRIKKALHGKTTNVIISP